MNEPVQIADRTDARGEGAGGLHGEHVLEPHGGLEARRLGSWLAGAGVKAASAIPTLAW